MTQLQQLYLPLGNEHLATEVAVYCIEIYRTFDSQSKAYVRHKYPNQVTSVRIWLTNQIVSEFYIPY